MANLLTDQFVTTIGAELNRTGRMPRGEADNRGHRRRPRPARTRQHFINPVRVLDDPVTQGGKRFFPAQMLHVADPFLPNVFASHGTDSGHLVYLWLYPNHQDAGLLCANMEYLGWNTSREETVAGDRRVVFMTDFVCPSARFRIDDTIPKGGQGVGYYEGYTSPVAMNLKNLCDEIKVESGSIEVIASPNCCGEWDIIVVCCP